MNNKIIAQKFNLLAQLMELHDENPFRIKSYASAYISLRNTGKSISEMTADELSYIKGIGSKISLMVTELLQTGQLQELEHWVNITPPGIVEMLGIKGLGPKKVKVIWKDMNIESIGELLYACNENRLIHYKGFGIKIQDDIKNKTEYYLASQGKFLYAHVHTLADDCIQYLKKNLNITNIELCGEIRRMMPVISAIEILSDTEVYIETLQGKPFEYRDNQLYFADIPVIIYLTVADDFYKTLFARSCSSEFLELFTAQDLQAENENAILKTKNAYFIPPEYRETNQALLQFQNIDFKLIESGDILGVIHNHSTYSDGLNTLQEMASYCLENHYAYFVISDHSQSAFYANGLKEVDIIRQWNEIDHLNKEFNADFKIYKGIESDILIDGALDYPADVLDGFDVVIASVHSVLNMDIEKATKRLLKAIENPYTDILGHPTGRLLLSRPGYPIHHKKIIDACADNKVAIELNANPLRLDIDWTWIPYALEKGVYISINPDAHSKESIHNIRYGVAVARKGGLTTEFCLNALNSNQFETWLRR